MPDVDRRVVDLQFNNKQFESGVSETLNSLDRLKNGLNIDGISDSVDIIADRFTTLGIIATTALQNIINKAIDTGLQLVKSLTLDPIMGGFTEYELKMGAIQTIMTNTAHKGTTMEQITDVLDELNQYADQTVFSFAQMTDNIGRFTANGVDLEDAAQSIKGIANVAAGAGANTGKMNTAMVQLSQSISAGKLTLQDWNSVITAGMGGPKLQNAFMDAAVAAGELDQGLADMVKNGEESFRNLVSAGKTGGHGIQFTRDIMLTAFKQMAEDPDLIVAATQIKTLTQLLDTLKESTESGWAETWEYIIGNKDEATAVWTAVSDAIGTVMKPLEEARNTALAFWKENGGRDALIQALTNAFQGLQSILDPIIEAFRNIFPPITGERLVGFTAGLLELTSKFQLSDENAEKLKTTFEGFFSILSFGLDAVKFLAGVLFELFKVISPIGSVILSLTSFLGGLIVALRESANATDFFGLMASGAKNIISGLATGISEGIPKAVDAIVNVGKTMLSSFENLFGDDAKNIIAGLVVGLSDGIPDAVAAIINVVTTMWEAFKDFFGIHSPAVLAITAAGFIIAGLIVGLTNGQSDLTDAAKKVGEWVLTGLDKGLELVSRIFNGVVATLGWVADGISQVIIKIGEAFGLFDNIDTEPLESLSERTEKAVDPLTTIIDTVKSVFGIIGTALSFIGDVIRKGLAAIGIDSLDEFVQMLLSGGLLVGLYKIVDILKSLSKGFGTLEGISGVLDGLKDTMAAMQNELKSNAILNIAKSIGILAGSLLLLSLLSPEEVAIGVSAITILMTELIVLSKMSVKAEGDFVQLGIMFTLLGIGMTQLAAAMLIMSLLSWEDAAKGVGIIGILFTGISAASKLANEATVLKVGGAMALLGVAMTQMSVALIAMKLLSWEDAAKGMAITGILFTGISAASKLADEAAVLKIGGAMALLGVAMTQMSVALLAMSLLSWEDSVKGVAIIGALFTGLSAASKLADESSILKLGGAMALLGVAMTQMSVAMLAFSLLSWESLAKGLVVIVGVIAGFSAASNLAKPESLMSLSAALVVMAAAINLMVPALMLLGVMPVENIAKALVTIALVLGIFIGTAMLLKTLTPVLVGFGVSILALGVGVLALAVGIELLLVVFEALGESLPKLLDFIVVIIDALMIFIVKLLDVIRENIPIMVEIILQFVIQILAALSENLPRILELVGIILTDILAFLLTFVPQVVDIILQLITSILLAIEENIDDIIDAAISIVLALIDGITRTIPKIADTILLLLKTIADEISKFIPELVNIGFTMITDFLNGMAKTIKEKVPELVDSVWAMIEAVVDGIVYALEVGVPNLKKQMTRVVTAMWNAFKEFFGIGGGNSETSEEGGTNIIQGIINGLINGIKAVIQAIKDVASSLWEAFKNFFGIHSPSTLMEGGSNNIIAGILKGLTGGIKSLATKAKEVGEAIFNGISNAVKNVGDIASNIVNTIGNGLSSGLKAVGDAAMGLGSSILGGLADVLGIASPAKEIISLMGYVKDGAVIGLQQCEKAVRSASEEVGEGVMEGMKVSLVKMGDIFNQDMDVQPIITPVIDMSNVEAGLNNTFGHQQTLNIAEIKSRAATVATARQPEIETVKNAPATDVPEQKFEINNHYHVRNDSDIQKINRGLDTVLTKFNRSKGVPVKNNG